MTYEQLKKVNSLHCFKVVGKKLAEEITNKFIERFGQDVLADYRWNTENEDDCEFFIAGETDSGLIELYKNGKDILTAYGLV